MAGDKPWKRKRPAGAGPKQKLTPEELARARAYAAAAGRRYPNLVDNMRVMKERKR